MRDGLSTPSRAPADHVDLVVQVCATGLNGSASGNNIASGNKMTERAYLREFEQLVLLSVLRLGAEAHGGKIREDLGQAAGRSVSVATIYVALSRMERRGFVRSWMSSPTPVRGGKSKKYYQLEPAGTEALREAKATLERMWQGVGTALDPSSA